MKKLRITFEMRREGSFDWHKTSFDVNFPDDVAEDVELHQHKSRYVEGPYHNGRGKKPIAELIQIYAELHGYDTAVFDHAEIIIENTEQQESR